MIFSKNFLSNWELEISNTNENVSLTFAVMEGKRNKGQYNEVYKDVHAIKTNHPLQPIYVLKSKHFFQRAYAVQRGANTFSAGVIAIFPRHRLFNNQRYSARKLETNTIITKQVYFPIVFSQYNPMYKKINISIPIDNYNNFSYSNGHWRIDGFGMFSIYKSDLTTVGGFNTNIKGWGNEDVDFMERVLKKRLSAFRAPSLSLAHIFHSKFCYKKLSKAQYISCEKVKWETDGSLQTMMEIATNRLTEVFLDENSRGKMHCPKFCTELKSMKVNRGEPICTRYC